MCAIHCMRFLRDLSGCYISLTETCIAMHEVLGWVLVAVRIAFARQLYIVEETVAAVSRFFQSVHAPSIVLCRNLGAGANMFVTRASTAIALAVACT